VPNARANLAARAADEARSFASAEEFRGALASALPLADRERVRAWCDSVLPPGSGTRGRRARSLESALAAPAASVAEEVAEDAIVAALTPVPGKLPVAIPAARKAPPPRPTAADATQVADDLIVGEATAPLIPRPRNETTPEIAFPRPAPPPAIAWKWVGAVASAALVAGFALGFTLGR
jgi:hypothetical protein